MEDEMRVAIEKIDEVIEGAAALGVDHEELLAEVYSRHMFSNDSDPHHIHGISFSEKVQDISVAEDRICDMCGSWSSNLEDGICPPCKIRYENV